MNNEIWPELEEEDVLLLDALQWADEEEGGEDENDPIYREDDVPARDLLDGCYNGPTWNGQPATPMWILMALLAAYILLCTQCGYVYQAPDPDDLPHEYPHPSEVWHI